MYLHVFSARMRSDREIECVCVNKIRPHAQKVGAITDAPGIYISTI